MTPFVARMSSRAARPALSMVAAVVLAGCGGTSGAGSGGRPDGGDADAPSAPPFEYRACAQDQKLGELKVSLEAGFTAVGGSFTKAVIPADRREVVLEADGCRLLRRHSPTCVAACLAGETCGEGGLCVPYPENASAGTITLSGLATPVRMTPRGVSRSYWDTSLPHPGFAPGAAIGLQASGADLPAFSLRGWGVSPLLLSDQALRLQSAQAFELSWQQGPEGPTRVQLTISVDQHGVAPVTLVCDSADSGVLVIPPTLVTALLDAGTSGYPTAVVARRTVDAVTLPGGCAEFVVTAGAERSLSVVGHLPCSTDADCPSGKACAAQLQTCL